MNIPKYINEKHNIVKLVSLTALFALIFINIYKPFSSESWYEVSDFMFFVYSSLIILTGVLVVIISRIIMYFYNRKHEISYSLYVFWVILEIIFMSLFYTIYTLSVKDGADVMETFKNSIINTSLVLLLPYATLWIYMGWKEAQKKLQKIEMDEEDINPLKTIAFKDEKGQVMLSIPLQDLLYVESSNNYVEIHYTSNGKNKKYLLRNTLKNMENLLENTSVGRCHRSYLVNFGRVKVMRREKGGLFLELDAEGVMDIPVSKSFQDKVGEKFVSNSF